MKANVKSRRDKASTSRRLLLEQIQLTEQLGFDEAWFAEHHQSDYGMLASPSLIGASIAETDELAWVEAPPQITRFWQLATDA